jgi:hypothetical protein
VILRSNYLTVFRSWIVTGFQHLMLCRFDTAVAFYRSAFDVLTSGQDIWKDVSPADRGHIFDMTFVRGVKRAYMLALFEVCHHPHRRTASENNSVVFP